jgi:hypothetical protein
MRHGGLFYVGQPPTLGGYDGNHHQDIRIHDNGRGPLVDHHTGDRADLEGGMTEQEAKNRWCPMIRLEIGPENAKWQGIAFTNRGEKFEPETITCIASRCMFWCWVEGQGDDGYCGIGRQI